MDTSVAVEINLPSRPTGSGPVRLSPHAVDRYNERVKPALGRADAEAELERLIAHGETVRRSPEWMRWTQATFNERYLVIAGDLVLPLRRCGTAWVAVTCLARGCISEASRERRNRHRARQRAARRDRSGGNSRGGRR